VLIGLINPYEPCNDAVILTFQGNTDSFSKRQIGLVGMLIGCGEITGK